jgi:hypothetical protein
MARAARPTNWRLEPMLPLESAKRENAILFFGIGGGLMLSFGLSRLLTYFGLHDVLTSFLGIALIFVSRRYLREKPPKPDGCSVDDLS